MKNRVLTTAIASVVLIITMATLATAGDMRDAMWQRQRLGMRGLLHCFASGAAASEYDQYAISIVSAEVNLMAYQVSPKDTRLVSRLAKDLKFPADYPLFAWRLLKDRLASEAGVSGIGAGGPSRSRSVEVVSIDRQFPGSLRVNY